jgi:phosphoribosylaminoimidazole (AIR) synthetase
VIDRRAWQPHPVFGWLQRLGNIADREMFSVFNMGLGLILAVPPSDVAAVVAACSTPEYPAMVLGEIRAQAAESPSVVIEGLAQG